LTCTEQEDQQDTGQKGGDGNAHQGDGLDGLAGPGIPVQPRVDAGGNSQAQRQEDGHQAQLQGGRQTRDQDGRDGLEIPEGHAEVADHGVLEETEETDRHRLVQAQREPQFRPSGPVGRSRPACS